MNTLEADVPQMKRLAFVHGDRARRHLAFQRDLAQAD